MLSDIGMPGDDGYVLISKLRRLPGHATTPAAAVTAYARSRDAAKAMQAGYQVHLSKPVEKDHLIDTVRKLVARGEARP